MARLSEARKRLRSVLRVIGYKLGVIWTSAKRVIKKAITKEVQYGLALLNEKGREVMDRLDEALTDPAMKGQQWIDEMKAFLKEKAKEVGRDFGGELRLRTSALTLIRELIFQARKEEKK